jgi:hypothetical protein
MANESFSRPMRRRLDVGRSAPVQEAPVKKVEPEEVVVAEGPTAAATIEQLAGADEAGLILRAPENSAASVNVRGEVYEIDEDGLVLVLPEHAEVLKSHGFTVPE